MATWNKKTYRRLQFWRKNLTQCYRSKDKIPQLWKSLYVNCCDFFYTDDFVGRIGVMLLNFTTLRSPDVFYNHASRSQKGKISRMRASKGSFQATVLSVHCLQTNEKQRSRKLTTTLNSSIPSEFHLVGFFKDENGQGIFLRFRPDTKKNCLLTTKAN